MFLHKGRVRCGVIIHHINDALHAFFVDCRNQCSEILHSSVAGIDCPVVSVGIGTAETPLFVFLADGMNRHKPYNVGAEGFNPIQIRNNG